MKSIVEPYSMKFVARLFTSIVFLIALCGIDSELKATHNRAGEITYEQIDDLTIRATIVTYTRTSSIAADRDSLTLFWGDGDSTVVLRSNGNGMELPNDIKQNIYTSEHTYPTRGSYTLSVIDPNRIAGILNIDFPNSVNIKFYLETTLTLLEPRFQGRNNSAILLQPPIDYACVGQVYTYNPNAYDIDGDSLAYELVTPLSNTGEEVPNYQLPSEITPGPDNNVSLDTETGNFTWNAPQTQGEYNITYRINEYRQGFLINSILRDMQILVRACSDMNNAPLLEVPELICVVAGTVVNIPIEASDIDSNEILTITASGGPFELDDSNAVLMVDSSFSFSMLSGSIMWQTTCDQISNEFYQIVVRVTDELSNDRTSLATLKTIQIKVVAPSPEIQSIDNVNNIISINWESPYTCEESDLFQGFSVWRRVGSSSVTIDTCAPGLEGQGFEKIVFLTNERDGSSYTAIDAEIDPGNIYCYRVVGEFGSITDQGNIYNRAQSLASEEICIRSSGDDPLITKVSVINTDEALGTIDLRWLNPEYPKIDTNILVGPYLLEVVSAPNLNGSDPVELTSFSYSSGEFGSINDTSFIHQNINTVDNGHSYQVRFNSGVAPDLFTSGSVSVSSIYLSSQGIDKSVRLTWESNVPWNNLMYYVFEQVDTSLTLIDSTADEQIVIEGLINGEESCFLIRGFGKYGIPEVKEPIINDSNKSCANPNDNNAPCSPAFEILSVCQNPSFSLEDDLINEINWVFNSEECEAAPDIEKFRVYFAPSVSDQFELLSEINGDIRSFRHTLNTNIAGCYQVTAIDSSGNESINPVTTCVDNCPSYILPNTFTPNSDSANDMFIPRENRFIEMVEFIVYNRWGQKVFETTDPAINWDGMNTSNNELAEGTYFYTCKVFERRVEGITEANVLKGTIQLIR